MDPIECLAKYHSALLDTCGKSDFADGTTLYKIHMLLKLTSQQLNSARVSTWRYNSKRTKIICHSLYEAGQDQFSSGMALSIEDFPSYFEAMASNRVVVADNAREHPATHEFTDSYLKPLGIYSMLDAPVYSSLGQHGVLCVEDTKEGRQWGIDEIAFVTAIADKISLAVEHDAWLKASERIKVAQRTDALTDLENRIAFQDRIEECFGCMEQPSCASTKALLVIGMDRFSAVNDELGYNKANDVLRTVAQKLEDLPITEASFPARLSGDLFALWIPKLRHNLVQLVERIQGIINTTGNQIHGIPVDLSASIGAIEVTGVLKDADNLVRKAEIALMKAKEKGLGTYAIFDDAWLSDYKQKKNAECELLTALKEQQLIPFYQPIIDSQTGKVCGLEALVRWDHPTRGILSPYFFLPLATEMRIMPQLGELMFSQVFKDIAETPELQSLSWVSINISSEQLYSTTLVSTISNLLTKFQIPSGMIELEIVEELISHDTKLVSEQFDSLGELGIRFSIDDFGTGYSSLARLKHLPVTKLKIDRSFVDGLPDDESDCCIASSIVGMAKGLNLDLVAEGVETPEQAQWLKQHECDFIQGYLYAKPMPLDELLKFLSD
ncbi:MAG: sensor domain-containing phosphodiesterase [Neptuniibacter sp.]